MARRGVRGDVTTPLGVGGLEERKKRRKEEIKEGKLEDLKKGLHALTRRVGGFDVSGLFRSHFGSSHFGSSS